MGSFIDMTGWVMREHGFPNSRLTVIDRAPNRHGKTYWNCICDCGTEKTIAGGDIRNGKVLSCGCYSRDIASERNFKDEVGNRFGRLTVIELIQKSPKAVWKCRCDCGNITYVKGIALRSGQIKSCGCLKSWPEVEITRILDNLEIPYKREYSFKDLFYMTSRCPLRFDFAIIKDESIIGLIEYNGDQHYHAVDHFGGDEGYRMTVLRDEMKKEYCSKNHIPLLILNKNNNLKVDIETFINEVWD